MSELKFVEVNKAAHKRVLTEFTMRYMEWIQENVKKYNNVDLFGEIGTPLKDYVEKFVNNQVNTPEYKMYLIHHTPDNKYIGMGAIRKHTKSIGEIKRMYVVPEYHGKGYGLQLLKFLLETAKSLGYTKIRLDTLQFMKNAQRIYDYVGFTEIPPFAESEVPAKLSHIMKYYEINTNILL